MTGGCGVWGRSDVGREAGRKSDLLAQAQTYWCSNIVPHMDDL